MANAPPVDDSAQPTASATPPALQNLGVIEADVHEEQDADSSLGDEAASSTASIGSSILRCREESGRTYLAYKDGQSFMPNHAREQERLDLQHHLFLLTFNGKLHLSPAGTDGRVLHNVLDVGTGTELWALDFADEHPESQVVGVDLSPIQGEFVLPNLRFQVDDLEELWMFGVKLDFIYSRMMTGALADWLRFFQQAIAWRRAGDTRRWIYVLLWLSLMGLTRVYGRPLPKQPNKEELDIFLADVRRDLKNPNIHAYWPIVVVYGQKPR
ncbi:hypothetical protein AK830_g11569 [Neonectria ditissima]|uniref:Methyltransferase domain-containing protein n=1 Tax=Neonectria ditissima TaxID=78410 RepID=A0A0P7ACJ2_9HYPO|nr:hypothetical protein AK830_g11569 [Neonectria ditissima]